MKYEFSLHTFLKLYQYNFSIQRAPLKQPAIQQGPGKILIFSEVDELTAEWYVLVLKELYKRSTG
jgi:hypothetical protein